MPELGSLGTVRGRSETSFPTGNKDGAAAGAVCVSAELGPGPREGLLSWIGALGAGVATAGLDRESVVDGEGVGGVDWG